MPPAFGLCDGCRHQRRIGNTRGSTFSLCGRSKQDDRFPRYPRMPVLRCAGFEVLDESSPHGAPGDGRGADRPATATDARPDLPAGA